MVLSPIKLEPHGERGFVDEEKANEIITLWTTQLREHKQKILQQQLDQEDESNNNNNLILCDRISLTDKSYSASAAKLIANFLKEPFDGSDTPIAHNIIEADISDCIAGRLTEEGLVVLQTLCNAFCNSNLVTVNLSDNAIGQQGIGACKTALSKKSLQSVALCNNGLSQETMAQVADILTNDDDGTSGCIASNLTSIHFYNNMSGLGGCKEFARILEKCRNLEDVRFSSTRAGKEGSDIVASALDASLSMGYNPKLTKLDLCDNNFANKSSHEALFRALGSTKSLRYLNLRDCDLEDDGVKKVCHALFESDSALEHLDLSGNEVGKRGAKHIADYIRDCGGELKVLHLEDNCDMTSKGAEHIAAAFHGSEDGHSIEEIQLNSCMIGAIGARALIDAYGPEGKDLPNLKKILLNGNSFTEEIVGELEVAFDDRLGELDDNDSDGDADDDMSDEDDEDDDEEEEQEESGGKVEAAVDDLAEAMGKSLVV